jgi:hypothetical protein
MSLGGNQKKQSYVQFLSQLAWRAYQGSPVAACISNIPSVDLLLNLLHAATILSLSCSQA